MTEHDNERLVFAALAGDLKLVEERIKFADNINFQYLHKGTALHQAAMGNKTEIALVLIQAGADVNVLSREGSLTPLDCASERHLLGMVALLKEHGGKATRTFNQYGSSPKTEKFVLPHKTEKSAEFEYQFKSPSNIDNAVKIAPIPASFEKFLDLCEVICNAECCGLPAFSFSESTVITAAKKIGTESLIDAIQSLLSNINRLDAPTILIERTNQYTERNDFISFLRTQLVVLYSSHEGLKNTKRKALNILKAGLSKTFDEGGCEWRKKDIESILKHDNPYGDILADSEVQWTIADWQSQGLIQLTGKEEPFLRVLKSLL